MAKQAVLYARVTVGSERLGKRLPTEQLEVCREYAAAHGLEIVTELAEDGHAPDGARRGRPQLKRVMQMAQAGEFDVLIVRDAARLSRKPGQLLAIAQELQRHGVQIELVFGGKPERVLPARKGKRATPVMEEVIVYARVSGERQTLQQVARQIEVLQRRARRRARRSATEPVGE